MQEKELRINVKSVWYSLACRFIQKEFLLFSVVHGVGFGPAFSDRQHGGTVCFHRVFLTYERYVNSCRECLQLPLSDERI